MSKLSKKLSRNVAESARAVKEITEEVQELLRHENDSEERARAMKMWEELGDGDNSIVIGILEESQASLEHLSKQNKLATAREIGLKEKVEKKQMDIQRHNKLFASLLNGGVQPTHQKEYEQLEEELIAEYER
jgi:dTDP-glucose pyrophosphorylase